MHSAAKLLLLALAPFAVAATPPPLPPPGTPARVVTDTMHGESIADPYRWLEGSAAPELAGKPDAELDRRVHDWSVAQTARTRAYFDALPGREAVATRLRALYATDSVGVPEVRGPHTLVARRAGNATNPTLFVTDASGVERELLAIDKQCPDGLTSLAFYRMSPGGKHLAYGLFRAGDENTTLHVLDIATGRKLADTIPGKVQDLSWHGDDAFVYHKLADLKNPYSKQIRYHRLGERPEADRLIFEQYKTGPLATTWGPSAHLDATGRYLVMVYMTGTASNDVWLVDFPHWLATGELRKTPILENADARSHPYMHAGFLYLHTTEGALTGRVFKIDPAKPARADWKEIIPAKPDSAIESVAFAKSHLVVSRAENALTRIEVCDLDGRVRHEVKQPGVGVASFSVQETLDVGYLNFSSLATPPSTYRVDLRDDSRSLYFRAPFPVNPDLYTVKQHFVTAKDGARVPLFVVHRKDVALDGKRPTIMWGYGGFAVPQKPAFSGGLMPWIDAGGVFAIAGIRGGSERGEAWHRAGMLDKKQTVFDDFIACGEYLVKERYTAPAHLGVRGGSNGGLLTGAVLTQRPDLFGAVYVGVPLLDMLRYQHFLMARYWVPEYGDPARAADFAWLKAYSPYHRVRAGVKYPATLIETGENDTRVHPMHARKMAARLQAATAGDPASAPILLQVDFESGHGAGKSFGMRVRDTTDTLLFFGRHLGLDFTPAAPAVAAPKTPAPPLAALAPRGAGQ